MWFMILQVLHSLAAPGQIAIRNVPKEMSPPSQLVASTAATFGTKVSLPLDTFASIRILP